MVTKGVASNVATGARIAAEEVGKTFGGPVVLDGISFDVRPGEFVALVGPSGCGKSTLLRMIAGLETPDHGTLRVAHAANDRPGRTAFVFQEPALLPWRMASGNVSLPLELDGVSKAERPSRVAASLNLAGLAPVDAAKCPRQLSGGMRMRVSLARAIVTEPDLLLLDEPFAAIDEISRQRLNEELHRLWRAQRWTAVFVTHNVSEAVFLAERVLVMSSSPGRIAGEVAIPFATPRDAELRFTPEFARLAREIGRRLKDAA